MRAAPHICIITPGALGSTPRVVKEAQVLTEAGFEVTVIATRTRDLVDLLDHDILARARWRAKRVDFRSRWKWRIRRTGQIALTRFFATTGWELFVDRGFSAFTGNLIAAAKEVKARLYIAHYPAALPAAAIAARSHDAIYAFDAEDFHLGDRPDGPANDLERRMIRAIEGRYLPGCAYVTAAAPGIADAYTDAYGISRPTVVLNVFPRIQAPAGPTPSGTARPGPSVYWFSQTIGPDRGLECAVRAIGSARSRPHLYLRGMPATGYIEGLRRVAMEAGAVDRLHVLPSAPSFQMERLAAVYDLGLSGEPGHTPDNRLALGNKLFTYLLAGLPIVASTIPSHVSFAAEVDGAMRLYAVDDAYALAAAIDGLCEDPRALATARAAAFALGQTRYNWDLEQSVLLTQIEASLSNGGKCARRSGVKNWRQL